MLNFSFLFLNSKIFLKNVMRNQIMPKCSIKQRLVVHDNKFCKENSDANFECIKKTNVDEKVENDKSMNVTTSIYQPKTEEVAKRKQLDLAKYLPAIDIGVDDDDNDFEEFFRRTYEEEEIARKQQRVGLYKSKGIKVFIPKAKMTPGTIRYQIDKLPENIPDDIRILFYR